MLFYIKCVNLTKNAKKNLSHNSTSPIATPELFVSTMKGIEKIEKKTNTCKVVIASFNLSNTN